MLPISSVLDVSTSVITLIYHSKSIGLLKVAQSAGLKRTIEDDVSNSVAHPLPKLDNLTYCQHQGFQSTY